MKPTHPQAHDNLLRVRANRARLKRCPLVKADWDQTAIAYARWLANRDGITLPDSKPRVDWSFVYHSTTGKNERRIRSVSWGREEDVYNTRKDGRRGAWLGRRFIAETSVAIPHWDWVPQVFEEASAPVAVRTERASYGGTIQLSQPVMVF